MIYFIQAGVDGPIKIGHTTNLKRRLYAMQLASFIPLTILATMEGSAIEEKRIHVRLRVFRIRGEWFSPTVEVLSAVREGQKFEYASRPRLVRKQQTSKVPRSRKHDWRSRLTDQESVTISVIQQQMDDCSTAIRELAAQLSPIRNRAIQRCRYEPVA